MPSKYEKRRQCAFPTSLIPALLEVSAGAWRSRNQEVQTWYCIDPMSCRHHLRKAWTRHSLSPWLPTCYKQLFRVLHDVSRGVSFEIPTMISRSLCSCYFQSFIQQGLPRLLRISEYLSFAFVKRLPSNRLFLGKDFDLFLHGTNLLFQGVSFLI